MCIDYADLKPDSAGFSHCELLRCFGKATTSSTAAGIGSLSGPTPHFHPHFPDGVAQRNTTCSQRVNPNCVRKRHDHMTHESLSEHMIKS